MTDNEQGSLDTSDIYLIHDDTLDLQPLSGLVQGRQLVGLHWTSATHYLPVPVSSCI